MVLVAESPCDLPRLLDALYNWCCKWKPGVNYEKSKIIHIRKKRKSRSEYIFCLGNCHLNYTKSYKYLEVYYNEHLDYGYTSTQFAASAQQSYCRHAGVRRPSVNSVFREPLKQINAKFGGRYLFTISPDHFFFKILHFNFFYDFYSFLLTWSYMVEHMRERERER